MFVWLMSKPCERPPWPPYRLLCLCVCTWTCICTQAWQRGNCILTSVIFHWSAPFHITHGWGLFRDSCRNQALGFQGLCRSYKVSSSRGLRRGVNRVDRLSWSCGWVLLLFQPELWPSCDYVLSNQGLFSQWASGPGHSGATFQAHQVFLFLLSTGFIV